MQQIERVGAVALLFLLVTIVAVALWQEGSGGEEVRAAESEVARAETRRQNPSDEGRSQRARGSRAEGQDALRSVRPRQRERASVPLTGGASSTPARSSEGRPGTDAPGTRPGGVRLDRPREQASRPNVAALPSGTSEGDDRLQTQGFRSTSPATGRGEAPSTRSVKPSRKATPASAAASAQSASGRVRYVVRRGDTLERIARHQLGDARRWGEIAALNGLRKPYTIREKQTLVLPQGAHPAPVADVTAPATTRPAPRPAQSSSAARPSGRTYVVRSGDVLSVIAERELGSSRRWREIVDLNPGLDPMKLHVGAELAIPAGAPRQRAPERTLVATADTDDEYRVR